MYIAGTISDFHSRLHQLAINQDDYDAFIEEGNGYLDVVSDDNLVAKWNTEFAKRKLISHQSREYFDTPALGANLSEELLGVLGHTILSVKGETITR